MAVRYYMISPPASETPSATTTSEEGPVDHEKVPPMLTAFLQQLVEPTDRCMSASPEIASAIDAVLELFREVVDASPVDIAPVATSLGEADILFGIGDLLRAATDEVADSEKSATDDLLVEENTSIIKDDNTKEETDLKTESEIAAQYDVVRATA